MSHGIVECERAVARLVRFGSNYSHDWHRLVCYEAMIGFHACLCMSRWIRGIVVELAISFVCLFTHEKRHPAQEELR